MYYFFSGATTGACRFAAKKNNLKLVDPVYFPQGPPRRKLVIFAKTSKVLYNINLRAVTLFYEKHVKLPKNFSDKTGHCVPSIHSTCTILLFWLLHLMLDVKQQKNKSKFVKRLSISRRNLPRKKMDIFAKMTKIIHNIMIRTVSLFCKKCTKFAKNIFCQM